MKIIWHGHSCMQIEEDGRSVICDPYAPGSVPGLRNEMLSADAVTCSHEHADHNYAAGVTLSGSGMPFGLQVIDCFHDPEQGTLRGPNRIHIFTLPSGLRAVHCGDLGHRLSREQCDAIGTPDVLMIPVGGFFTINAEEAAAVCEDLRPRIIIPMHYRGSSFGYDVIGPVSDFLALFNSDMVHKYDVSELELSRDTARQVAVLRPRLLADENKF